MARAQINRKKDDLCSFIAAKILPKRLVMWAYYRVVVHATTGDYSNQIVPDLSAMDAVDRFAQDNKLFQ